MKMFLSAVSALMMVTLPAAAGPAAISDTVTFFQNGAPFVSSPFFEPGGEGLLTILQSLNSVTPTGDLAQFGNYTVLTEPDGTISDVFGVVPDLDGVIGGGGGYFAFISDPEGGLGSVPIEFVNPAGGTPIMLAEGNNGPFSVTAYLSPTLRAQGFTGTFQSDADTVPEPATLALLDLGLAGLGFSRRKQ